jgi:hypothetical protein
MSPAPGTSGLPAGPNAAGGVNGPGTAGSGSGGNSWGGVQGGIGAALIALLTLVLLRLARRAAAVPIWRSYLPEVPPA